MSRAAECCRGDPVPPGVLIIVEIDLSVLTARETGTGLEKICLAHVVLTREQAFTRARRVLRVALVLGPVSSTSSGRVEWSARRRALSAILRTGGRR